ncbi:hypothetical protein [Bradyrhizobium sp. 45]|uniref:hypothetical protein n=1 Tax=Bradyrhizobium sp. 45 TaxID=1043587 RepID=UPI001FF9C8F5|nr:hypothetical protein [Bradyrhizobium sp. 45]MCK1307648.1 hypothetical protein [Bradyrhizobium sp. 45]
MIGDFKVTMENKWYITAYETFNKPAGNQLTEKLRVTLTGNTLLIEGLKDMSSQAEAVISARRSLDFTNPEMASFVIVEDNLARSPLAFPAMGTAVVFMDGSKRRLRAAGFDRNGAPKGWIFDATEVPS